uniref:Uncharacterized protein n=1 Tax=Eptatretus burgeri TaxID=7764 RepID=A0A8C4QK02_EPTBU
MGWRNLLKKKVKRNNAHADNELKDHKNKTGRKQSILNFFLLKRCKKELKQSADPPQTVGPPQSADLPQSADPPQTADPPQSVDPPQSEDTRQSEDPPQSEDTQQSRQSKGKPNDSKICERIAKVLGIAAGVGVTLLVAPVLGPVPAIAIGVPVGIVIAKGTEVMLKKLASIKRKAASKGGTRKRRTSFTTIQKFANRALVHYNSVLSQV